MNIESPDTLGNINFQCNTECGGKCCVGTTNVLASEFRRVMYDAPITPMITIMMEKKLPKEFSEKMETHALPVMVQGKKFFVFLDFLLGVPSSKEACIFLKDGLCGIYDDRPLKCKLFPIYPFIPESDMGRSIESLKCIECTAFKDSGDMEYSIWKEGHLQRREDKLLMDKYLLGVNKNRQCLESLMNIEAAKESKDRMNLGVTDLIRGLSGQLLSPQSQGNQVSGVFAMPYHVGEKSFFSMLSTGVKINDFMEAQVQAHKKAKDYDLVGWENVPSSQKQLEELINEKRDRKIAEHERKLEKNLKKQK